MRGVSPVAGPSTSQERLPVQNKARSDLPLRMSHYLTPKSSSASHLPFISPGPQREICVEVENPSLVRSLANTGYAIDSDGWTVIRLFCDGTNTLSQQQWTVNLERQLSVLKSDPIINIEGAMIMVWRCSDGDDRKNTISECFEALYAPS